MFAVKNGYVSKFTMAATLAAALGVGSQSLAGTSIPKSGAQAGGFGARSEGVVPHLISGRSVRAGASLQAELPVALTIPLV